MNTKEINTTIEAVATIFVAWQRCEAVADMDLCILEACELLDMDEEVVRAVFEQSDNVLHLGSMLHTALTPKESVQVEVKNFAKKFMTDVAAVRTATQAAIDADPIRACAESGRYLADAEDQAVIRVDDVNRLEGIFADAITGLSGYADRTAEVHAQHKAQLDIAKAFGIDTSAIMAEVKAEIEAAASEANEIVGDQFTRDPLFEKARIELSRKIAGSRVDPSAIGKGLVHKAVKARALANGMRQRYLTRQAADAVREIKVAASVFNTGARAVTNACARAIAVDRFTHGEFNETFRYEGREFHIDKAVDAPIPEGLWSDNDPLFGLDGDTIYALFDEWKGRHANELFAIMEQRRTIGVRGVHTFSYPIGAVALEYATSRSSKDGFFNEYEYREYSLEDRIEEELLRCKVAFALQAREREFAGSDDHHEGYLDW